MASWQCTALALRISGSKVPLKWMCRASLKGTQSRRTTAGPLVNSGMSPHKQLAECRSEQVTEYTLSKILNCGKSIDFWSKIQFFCQRQTAILIIAINISRDSDLKILYTSSWILFPSAPPHVCAQVLWYTFFYSTLQWCHLVPSLNHSIQHAAYFSHILIFKLRQS